MGFEVLIKQVQAIASVTGQMGGHVASAYSRASVGALTSPVLGAQLMMGDALRLLALVKDLPSKGSQDFEMGLGEVIFTNTLSWAAVNRVRDQMLGEVDAVKEVTRGLREALDVVRSQIGQVALIREQLASLQSIVGADATALSGARELLDQQIMPALYQFRSTMEELLWTYERELEQRELNLWRMETVFKYVTPPRRLRKDNWKIRKKNRKKKRLKAEKKLAKKKLREEQGGEAPATVAIEAVTEGAVEGAHAEASAPAKADEGAGEG